MPQSQDMRELVAKMKLIPNKEVIQGKKMVFLDDSIVRGTQLKDNTKDLRMAGAKEDKTFKVALLKSGDGSQELVYFDR